jgi:alcohol dehydrogenase, propanol-preferring
LILVYAVDTKPAARQLALELGAEEAFDLNQLTNQTNKGFKVDITIDFVSSAQSQFHFPTVVVRARLIVSFLSVLAFAGAFNALRGDSSHYPDFAKAVMVGISSETLSFSLIDALASGISGWCPIVPVSYRDGI